MFFTPQDLFTVGVLVFLEGILSIDNALVLALMARELPPEQRKKALTYGLAGAVVFRLISLGLITHLLEWRWVKFLGGGYLLFLSLKHFWDRRGGREAHSEAQAAGAPTGWARFWHTQPGTKAHFWKVVLLIELTDIAFAIDSILAAVALSNKYWVIFTGGILGVIAMRFAANQFLKVLERFPGFETTAYLLVLVIGNKVILEALRLPGVDFHSASSPYFWGFWAIMAVCILWGFRKKPTNH